MRVEMMSGLRPSVHEEVTRLVAYGPDNTPIAAVIEVSPGAFIAVHADDANFHQVLRACGCDRTVLVRQVPLHPLTGG